MSPYMRAYQAGIKLAQLEWMSKVADGTELIKSANILRKGLDQAKNLVQRHVHSRKPIGGIRPEVFKEFRANFPKQPKGMSGGEYLRTQVTPYVHNQPVDIRMGLDQHIASKPGATAPAPRLSDEGGWSFSRDYADYWADSLNPGSIVPIRRAEVAARYLGR